MAETTLLTASTSVALADPDAMLERLSGHLAEHGTVRRDKRLTRFKNAFGAVDLEVAADGLRLRASARDPNHLFLAKSMLA